MEARGKMPGQVGGGVQKAGEQSGARQQGSQVRQRERESEHAWR